MSRNTLNATARVRVTLELEVGAWGEDCDIAQVFKQASSEAVDKCRGLANVHGARIVGIPEVQAIIVPRDL